MRHSVVEDRREGRIFGSEMVGKMKQGIGQVAKVGKESLVG